MEYKQNKIRIGDNFAKIYTVIKYPKNVKVGIDRSAFLIEDTTDYSKLNRFHLVESGERVALIGMGNMFSLAQEAAKEIEYELGFRPTIINPRFLTGIDEDMLDTLKRNHELVVTLEDGILNGGFGEKIARFYGPSDMKVYCLGGLKEFTDRISAQELYNRYHLTKEQITEDIRRILG